ncbi:hypothetical protein Avbf_10498, partial [Armadillidium vulgare]
QVHLSEFDWLIDPNGEFVLVFIILGIKLHIFRYIWKVRKAKLSGFIDLYRQHEQNGGYIAYLFTCTGNMNKMVATCISVYLHRYTCTGVSEGAEGKTFRFYRSVQGTDNMNKIVATCISVYLHRI